MFFKKKVNPAETKEWKSGRSTIKIGRFTYGYENLKIQEWGEGANLNIGSFCSIASSVNILLGGNHRTDWITTYPFGHIFKTELGETEIQGHPTSKGNIEIGNDVWLGQGCTILSGISIGNGAVIGTNTTVTKNVPAYTVITGNPGRIIKFRFDDEIITLLESLAWWNLPIDSIKEITSKLSQAPTKNTILELIDKFHETI